MKKTIAALLLVAVAAPLSYFGVGYAVASLNAASCEGIAFQEAIEKDTHGFDMSRTRVGVPRSALTSSVSPFSVEVTYSVPRDLHATVFTKTCRVSALGKITPGKVRAIHLM